MAAVALLFALVTLPNGDFHTAIYENDLQTVRTYLEQGHDPNEYEDGIHSPFQYAKTIDMIDLLIEYGALPDLPDSTGKTAIWYADEPEILRHLLKNGASPDGGILNGCTLIEVLCSESGKGSDKRTIEKIDLLRANGANYTPRCIISLSDLREFEKLEVDTLDQETLDNLFAHAVDAQRAIIAYLLLKSGANPNLQPQLLLEALKSRELTTLLLDYGQDFAAEFDVGEFGHSGPDLAARHQAIHRASSDPDYFEGLTVLLERGEDPNILDSNGETPLFWAIRAASQTHSDTLRRTILVLLRSGALNSIENKKGETPITLVQTLRVSDSIRSIVTSRHFSPP